MPISAPAPTAFYRNWYGFLRAPLRVRFIKGLALMLLPLLLLGIGSLLALEAMEQNLSELSDEIRHELALIDRVDMLVVRCSASASRFFLLRDETDRRRLKRQIDDLDRVLAGLVPQQFADQNERALLEAVQRQWLEQRRLGRALIEAGVDAAALSQLQPFSEQLEQMSARLAQARRLAEREIDQETREFAEGRRGIRLLVSSLFLAGLVLAIGSARLLARSVLRPVMELEAAALALRQGALETRVAPHGRDELAGLMESFNAMAANLQENQRRLAEMAMTDPLTGLFNRREFMERLATELERAGRYGRPLALLLLDFDHFKQVNDRFGHQAGDQALQAFAQVLRQQMRQGDLAARYGGEEFVIMLPETTLEAALIMAERVRQATAGLELAVADETLRVTVSIGCVPCTGGSESREALLAAADRALYRAKAEGRNRVCGPEA